MVIWKSFMGKNDDFGYCVYPFMDTSERSH